MPRDARDQLAWRRGARLACFAHPRVCRRIVQQAAEPLPDAFVAVTDQAYRPRGQFLLSLAFAPQNECGHREGRGFLLNTARVGERKIGAREQIVEGKNVERLAETHTINAGQLLVGDFSSLGVEMHGIEQKNVLARRHRIPYRTEAFAHRGADILPSVRRHKDQPTVFGKRKERMRKILFQRVGEGINDGISDAEHALLLALAPQMLAGGGARCEVGVGNDGNGAPVQLLGKGRRKIPRAQPRLHVQNGNG